MSISVVLQAIAIGGTSSWLLNEGLWRILEYRVRAISKIYNASMQRLQEEFCNALHADSTIANYRRPIVPSQVDWSKRSMWYETEPLCPHESEPICRQNPDCSRLRNEIASCHDQFSETVKRNTGIAGQEKKWLLITTIISIVATVLSIFILYHPHITLGEKVIVPVAAGMTGFFTAAFSTLSRIKIGCGDPEATA